MGTEPPGLDQDQRGLPRTPPNDVGSVERQPDDPDPIFLDGFESAGTGNWSAVVGN